MMSRHAWSNEELLYIFYSEGGRCHYCRKQLVFDNYGRRGERGAWELDHKVPVIKGGSDTTRNAVPACYECHSGKGTRPAYRYRKEFEPVRKWGKVKEFFGFDPGRKKRKRS
jgi:5-methylcytosine-specific restriction endonuclease McrA